MRALSQRRVASADYRNSNNRKNWVSPALNAVVLETAANPRSGSRFSLGTLLAYFLKSKRKESLNQHVANNADNSNTDSSFDNFSVPNDQASTTTLPMTFDTQSFQSTGSNTNKPSTDLSDRLLKQHEENPYLRDEYCVLLSNDQGNSTLFNQGLLGIEYICRLPKGVNHHEWIVSNECSFFANINLIYHSIREFCTVKTCPRITGYDRQSYWLDSKGRKIKCCAQQYIDLSLEYVDRILSIKFENEESTGDDRFGYCNEIGTFRTIDPSIAPKYVDPYSTLPIADPDIIRRVVKSLLRIACHIYQSHFDSAICKMHLHQHLNSVFLHFMIFNLHFNFLEARDSDVLNGLFHRLLHQAIRGVIDRNGPNTRVTERMEYPSSKPCNLGEEKSKGSLLSKGNLDCELTGRVSYELAGCDHITGNDVNPVLNKELTLVEERDIR